MEITLSRQEGTQVAVACDDRPSHTFDLRALTPGEGAPPPQPLDDPIAYGRVVYAALFPDGAPAAEALAAGPDRILLVATDDDVQAVPWEYAYGPDGFLVLDYPFVRGLPAAERRAPPALETGLHIVAVPSNPLDAEIPPLDIEGEWRRLREEIEKVPYAITLERTRPPAIGALRNLVAGQKQRVVHFMGHGGQLASGAALVFEAESGAPELVSAREFVRRLRGSVFLVTLNACVSATPGPTAFSNLAAALARHKTPYALGMRFSIVDDDARAFARAFYNDLARGTPVEEALLQARLTLAGGPRAWAIGVPVLYTALANPPVGFARREGRAVVDEHPPLINAAALPRATGAFQGRVEELLRLGDALTRDSRPRVLTIHGGGGQGKTALAREAVERFAFAWPGGAWAISLETLPSREIFANTLAQFLEIATGDGAPPAEIERRAVQRLAERRTLVVLDNAETLVDAARADSAAAAALAQFIQQLPATVSLLVTSREHLGLSGETGIELPGLHPTEGARLFRQSAPQRTDDVKLALAAALSEKVEGHPLSLRLLGGAFNGAGGLSLPAFVAQHEQQLVEAEDKYAGLEHRHRKLYASIDTSVRYLDDDLCALLSSLWVFHAPFWPVTAAAIFAPDADDEGRLRVFNGLHTLWERSLLVRERYAAGEGTLLFYRVLPTVRPYLEHYLPRHMEREPIERGELLRRFGAAHAALARRLYRGVDRDFVLVMLAQQAREDFERGLEYVEDATRAWYRLHWGWVIQRLGDRRRGLELAEQTLEWARDADQDLLLQALNNMAAVYQATGNPQRALDLYEEALPLMRAVGDRAGEAATLNNMGRVYQATGNPQRALDLYAQALPLMRAVGDRAGEAATLCNMSLLFYGELQRPEAAIGYLEQAIAVLTTTGLDRDAAGVTLDRLRQVLADMRGGRPLGGGSGPATMPPEQLRVIVANTVAVMTSVAERRDEWRGAMQAALEDARVRGADWQIEADFFAAILQLLDGQPASLPDDHPYAATLDEIRTGIAGGVDPRLLEAIANTTLAVLGPAAARRAAWQQSLRELREQATAAGATQLAALAEAADGLVEAAGDPAGLGAGLTGLYAQVWQAIVAQVGKATS